MLNGGDDAGPKNVVEAARLYRVGAESGSSYCMWMLGQRYEAGTAGLPRDLVQARYWYQKAADAGDAIGKKLLDALPPQ
jgi:TPR repeat protein